MSAIVIAYPCQVSGTWRTRGRKPKRCPGICANGPGANQVCCRAEGHDQRLPPLDVQLQRVTCASSMSQRTSAVMICST
jgi:hypothetical protein